MIYELRVYRVVQGRMAALLTRFEHQTLPIMVRHWHPASRVLDDRGERPLIFDIESSLLRPTNFSALK